jgi:microsomal dipeptidase-like Zn-dependent dipeptidase
MHCDLLSYLATVDGSSADDRDRIGCAIPHLRAGNVKLQVMAIWAADGDDAPALAQTQVEAYHQLLAAYADDVADDASGRVSGDSIDMPKIGMVASIENASCLCTADEPLERAFERLAQYRERLGRIVYISLTHHRENRFGGGNRSTAGLTDDGRALIEHLSGQRIALDLSHASDAMAFDALNWIDKKGLDIPILASHSNFRHHCNEARNLPDELAREIIRREGLIGINFIRPFVDLENPAVLYDHIAYGFELGGERALCLGADYCYIEGYDGSRGPIFWPAHENAGCYTRVLGRVEQILGPVKTAALAHGNAVRFLRRLWDKM